MQWAINYFADFIDPGNFRRRGKVTLKANRRSSGAILFAIDNLPEASEAVFATF
jgi:hypothetical protein